MAFTHDDKKQRPVRGAANSPHFQQEGIRSAMPPKQLFSEIEEPSKEEALQKKEKNHADSGSGIGGGDIPPYDPNNNKGENNILNILQRRHKEATKDQQPKQYKRFEPKNLTPRQFKKVEPFQLSQSLAYQRSLGQEKPVQKKASTNGLPEEVQAKMENSMGHDFSNVNIHKESSSATDAGALAYAQGNDVHFAPGQFKPNTTSGQELIGHELAHVVQQREGRVQPTKTLGKGMAVNDDVGLEREADEMGQKAAQMKSVDYPKSSNLGKTRAITNVIQRTTPEDLVPQIHALIEEIEAGNDRSAELANLVHNISDEDAEEVKRIYEERNGVNLLEALYRLFNDNQFRRLTSIVSWLVNTNSSDQALGRRPILRDRSSSDLLPGVDPFYPRTSNNRLYFDIAGRYAIQGESLRVVHTDDTVVIMAPGSQANLPVMETAVVISPSNHFSRFSVDHSNTRQQSFEFTPTEVGHYSLMAWVRHPDGHQEVKYQGVDVKSLRDISSEARGEVETYSFELFRAQLEFQEMVMGDMGSRNQGVGNQQITSSARNPIQSRIGNRSIYRAVGFDNPEAQINWLVNIESEFLPTEVFYGLRAASSDAQSRYPISGEAHLYTAGTGSTANVPLFTDGIFNIIAEEIAADGSITGRRAVYRQVVLDLGDAGRLAEFQRYQQQVDNFVENIQEGHEVPVQAAFTNEENASSIAITMFIGPSSEDGGGIVLLDFTPGVTRREFDGNTVQECLEDFSGTNTYPDGRISLTIPVNEKGVQSGSWTMETDGASLGQRLSSRAGWASLGFAALGIGASLVPGGQVVAPFLFITAAGLSAVAGAASLADRFREAEVSTSGVTLDILGIAASVFGGAAAFRAMRGGAAALQLTSGGRFLLYSGLALDGASALVLSVDGIEQINRVLDSQMPRGEKIGAIARIIANLALVGGLFALSVRDVNSLKRNLSTRFGEEVVSALDNRALYSLSLLDDVHLGNLQRAPTGELTDYLDLISTDLTRGQQLLRLSNLDNFANFRTVFNALDSEDLVGLARVLDRNYLAGLSGTMRPRYERFLQEIANGTIPPSSIKQNIAVMLETQSIRNTIREALSEGGNQSVRIGQRNIAHGSFEVTLPDGTVLSDDFVSISGLGTSSTTASELGVNIGNRTIIPEINSNRRLRVFSHTQGRAAHDSERKIFEHILDQMSDRLGFRFNAGTSYADQGFSGRIIVNSEMTPCNSCANIIETQFRNMFGASIDVTVRNGVTYP